MAKPLKQWKSYTQQLQLLESRGMIVTDNAKALNYLERVGYYRLSGYWYPFRQIDVQASKAQNKPIRKNEFVQQSNFENIPKEREEILKLIKTPKNYEIYYL